MKMLSKLYLIAALFFLSAGYSQTDNKAVAIAKGERGVKLMDEGKYDEALTFLNEAQKLDPENYSYPYEIGYLYFIKKDYKKAIEIYQKVIKYKDITDQCFQMLGSLYDYTNDTAKAFNAYKEGLKLFPNSGKLYLEIGTVYWSQKQYDKAIPYYEKGIEVDPKFPSNYYRAARLYCNSTEEVWGMIYGEIFMDLERNSERTAEISKLLYNTYKKEIKFTDDNSFTVSFSKNNTITINDAKDARNIKLPFGIGVYEPLLMIALVTEKNIDINSLDRIRSNFVDNYYKNDNEKKYPNVLFGYQKRIKDAGHFEAYNHWILMKGDEPAFTKWKEANGSKWDNFITWFNENKILINNDNKFYREQY
jgi:tetratricopeptide (TPR) repeat protein